MEAPENVEKKYKKDVKRHQEQERKDQMERQKKENDLKKKFQVASVRKCYILLSRNTLCYLSVQ